MPWYAWVARHGQVSIWCSLPKDNLGAVLDLDDLTASVARALAAGATVLDALGVGGQDRVVVAAELAQTTLLTGGSLASLGARSSASMRGALGRAVLLNPDESVPVVALENTTVSQVARTVAGVLMREWLR